MGVLFYERGQKLVYDKCPPLSVPEHEVKLLGIWNICGLLRGFSGTFMDHAFMKYFLKCKVGILEEEKIEWNGVVNQWLNHGRNGTNTLLWPKTRNLKEPKSIKMSRQ